MVSLTTTGTSGETGTETKNGLITAIAPAGPVTGFAADGVTGKAPLTITDQSHIVSVISCRTVRYADK